MMIMIIATVTITATAGPTGGHSESESGWRAGSQYVSSTPGVTVLPRRPRRTSGLTKSASVASVPLHADTRGPQPEADLDMHVTSLSMAPGPGAGLCVCGRKLKLMQHRARDRDSVCERHRDYQC
jgi:hypothetical protein